MWYHCALDRREAMKIGCFGKLIIKCSIEARVETVWDWEIFLEAIFLSSVCTGKAKYLKKRVENIFTSYLSSVRSVITNLCLFYYGDHFSFKLLLLYLMQAAFQEGLLGWGQVSVSLTYRYVMFSHDKLFLIFLHIYCTAKTFPQIG